RRGGDRAAHRRLPPTRHHAGDGDALTGSDGAGRPTAADRAGTAGSGMRRLPWMLLRTHAREPAQAVLMLLGLALSVAVVLAVDLGIDSARTAFGQSRQALSGGATHQLIGESGRIDQTWLAQLRREAPTRSAPMIEASLVAIGADGGTERRLRLLGIDPLSEFAFRPWLLQGGEAGADSDVSGGLIGAGEQVLIDSASAARLGVDN